MTEYIKEQLAKISLFLKDMSYPVERKLNPSESGIALASHKYLESILKGEDNG
jgi:hypothetical protein